MTPPKRRASGRGSLGDYHGGNGPAREVPDPSRRECGLEEDPAHATHAVRSGARLRGYRKERHADWQRYKFEIYRELVQSLSGIVESDSTAEGHRRFAAAYNTVHLIASQGVIAALHDFQDEIRVSNPNRDRDRHDTLLSRLEREIRKDLSIPGTPPMTGFQANLWCSGSPPEKG